MSTKSKGRKHEKEAMAVYEKLGAGTWSPAKSSRCVGPDRWISQSQDIMEAFDFIGWNHRCIDFVQVKSGESHASEARKLIDELDLPYPSRDIAYIVLMRIPRKPRRFVRWIKDRQGKWHRGPWPEEYQIEHFGGEL